MLLIFNYLKRYHSDILDALCILLGFINLKIHAPEAISALLQKAKKRRGIENEFSEIMQNLLGDLFIAPNANLNLIKILRMIDSTNPTNEDIEILINTITQKKTINKLYAYSTPMEINRLMADILEIKDGDEIYNPCYGIGSLFLALTRTNRKISIYGEELDSSLDKVARLILKAINIDSRNLFVNNILKKQIFPLSRKFSKIICNPPLDIYIGILDLKNDERFAHYGLITKSAPELSFIINGISYLKEKGVFIIRNQLLKKTSVEEKFKEILCQNRLIEAIIELPSNIFPHNSAEFSLMILSKQNSGILHIDATSFHKKEGKYNHLIKSDEILSLLKSKKNTRHSKFSAYSEIDISDLRAQSYLKKRENIAKTQSLKSIGAIIIRGARIANSKKAQKYLNVGIVNFNECGFIDCASVEEHFGDKEKISQNALKPYDILLSLRGIHPKISIVGNSNTPMVANAGITIIRAKNRLEAYGLYCFLFSNKAREVLRDLYWQNERKSIDISALYEIRVPLDFTQDAEAKFREIQSIGREMRYLESRLASLREDESSAMIYEI